mgnify:CR=1 FL=1
MSMSSTTGRPAHFLTRVTAQSAEAAGRSRNNKGCPGHKHGRRGRRRSMLGVCLLRLLSGGVRRLREERVEIVCGADFFCLCRKTYLTPESLTGRVRSNISLGTVAWSTYRVCKPMMSVNAILMHLVTTIAVNNAKFFNYAFIQFLGSSS